MIYKYRPGTRMNVKASVAGPALLKVREKHGQLSPDAVLTEARAKRHPLHPAFEWDDKRAATAHRKAQARALIRSIVMVQEGDEDALPVRLFVNVNDADEQFYETVAAAYADDATRARVLAQAPRDLDAWQRRYDELAELAEVFEAAARVKASA